MKQKKVQYLIFVALLLLVGSFVTYRAMLTTPSAEMAPEARVLAIMEEGGCISCHSANPQTSPLASIRQMSRQGSRGSAGKYQADEQAGVPRLRWQVSGS